MRTETFATPGPVSLVIRIPAGDIEIETGEVADTTVELEVRGLDADELEREARIEARARGSSSHEIVLEARPPGFASLDGEYRVRVSVPHGADVRAEVASADLRGRGRFGEVELASASGDVAFEDVAGAAKVDTASGDIALERVGSGRINSASGDVAVGEAAGPVEVNTASGDVAVRSAIEGAVKVHSASGDVEVGIAKGSRLWVDAQSASGETSSELELEAGEPIADEGGPLVELRAQTMSGDISIRRA